jgi:tetraacyldisaccharide 4'-kinase
VLKSFRYLLFPFAALYGAVIFVRNRLFDKNILKSASFNFPLICVGNLAVGGTGKTPMVEYILTVLGKKYKTATVSRGYRRKTRGYLLAGENTSALEIGDEPMQIHLKFPDVSVAVGEERLVAIPQLLHDRPDMEVVVLDDAFQHRSIRAGLNILLTDYNNLFTQDHLLPVGDLRDLKSESRRAHIIVVTKCPPDLSQQRKENLMAEINPHGAQTVFFTAIEYSSPYHLFTRQEINITEDMDVLLVCGIANPDPVKRMLNESVRSYEMLRYNDHHIFNLDDLEEIKNEFEKIQNSRKIILTTEKDAVRLLKFRNELSAMLIAVLPVRHKFLFQESSQFEHLLLDFVEGFVNNKAN